jgi:hypothetical protein
MVCRAGAGGTGPYVPDRSWVTICTNLFDRCAACRCPFTWPGGRWCPGARDASTEDTHEDIRT